MDDFIIPLSEKELQYPACQGSRVFPKIGEKRVLRFHWSRIKLSADVCLVKNFRKPGEKEGSELLAQSVGGQYHE